MLYLILLFVNTLPICIFCNKLLFSIYNFIHDLMDGYIFFILVVFTIQFYLPIFNVIVREAIRENKKDEI